MKNRGFGIALPGHPQGSVLLVVLVIVAVLTLVAYNYTQTMLTEFEAATMTGSEIQSRESADSAVEYIATMLANRTDPALENLQHNPTLFLGKQVISSTHTRGDARFSIIAPVENSPTGTTIRYGLMDESAKLNVNLLLTMQLSDDDIHTMMLNIPNMTVEIADAILDWIDTDDTKRANGAETETYQGMTPPYRAKNGPLESLDELLMVKGVTPALLYGEDANRNGLLDPNENDGDASPPIDNRNGVLDHGWVSFLTAYGRESNLRADGRPKIHLNNGLLTDLYDALEDEFGTATAQFVISVRMNGATAPSGSGSSGSGNSGSGKSGSGNTGGGNSGGGNSNSNKQGGSSGNKNNNTAGNSGNNQGGGNVGGGSGLNGSSSAGGLNNTANNQMNGLTKAIASALSNGGKVTRGGIDITAGGAYQITSMWALFGSTTTVVINGNSKQLTSPWPADTNQLKSVLPKLLDTLSTSNDEYIDGRININQARREILLGIPGVTEDLVEKIIQGQKLDQNGQPSPEVIQQHNTTGWLFFEGLVDLPTMQTLDPYFTARGDVYRAQVFGFFEGGGPITRLEAMIDGTQNPPRVIFQRDLNDLGHGYSRTQLYPLARKQ